MAGYMPTNFASLPLLTDVVPNALLGLAKEAMNSTWRTVFGRPLTRAQDASRRPYKYSIRAPWPQPNPHAPDEMAPVVLHLPEAELREFSRVILARLARQLRQRLVPALWFAHKNQEIAPISDSEHVRHLTETLFARSMTTELDPSDRAALGTLADSSGVVYKLDLTAADLLKPLPGTFTGGCLVYFVRPAPSARCVPLGIVFPEAGVAPLLIRPVDGNAWELSKHYAISSASYLGLLGTHTLLHFPSDALNAITKAVLPLDHTLSRLLMPHLYMQLCLNFSVQHIDKSPYHNNQNEFFTGLTYDGPTTPWRITRRVYSGMEGNPTYPAYVFPREVQKTHSDYGDFLGGYYRIIKAFVAEVLADVTIEDPRVLRWADECARHVRGFPDAEEMQDRDVLVSSVAYIICNNSVIHSVDHYSWGTIPLLDRSLRMRVPPPRSRDIPALDRSAFTTVDDRFRLFLTDEMALTPTRFVETRLEDVDYAFPEPHLRAANARFIEELKTYDRNPGVTRHTPLHDIAASIQY